jgi:YfiH family protein
VATVVGELGARVRWAFADRRDGVSLAPFDLANLADHVGDDPAHVDANRARLAGSLGLGLADVVAMAPVHGDGVGIVERGTSSPVPEVDALVTAAAGLALLTLAADCVPVVLGDDEAGVVAVVHSGWKGVVVDVVGATLDAMASLGARAERTRAVVGPSICGSCYAVPAQRFDDVVAAAPAAAARARDGQPGLDLRAAVVVRLAGAGVDVTTHGGCTAESDALFSYRRDHVTGRHGGIVTLLPQGRAR